MYNEKTAKQIILEGQINIINVIAISIGKDINIINAYYKYYNEYPSLLNVYNTKEDIKFKIFERRYKIEKLLKK